MTPDALLSEPGLDIVLNLTPPAVHFDVTRLALQRGKHVYSEKPLAMVASEAGELLTLAETGGLLVACAPDTFLGGAYQAARALIDEGAIGTPLAVAATMLAGGQESWHPDPDIFFKDGAGPLLDMGPYYVTAIVALLGPVVRVAGFASTRVAERAIEIGPRAGERFAAETPTHTTAIMELDAGVTATLVASFEAPRHYASTVHVLGSEGSLSLPDPNMFEGPVRMRVGHGDWTEVSYASRGAREARESGCTTWPRRSQAGVSRVRRESSPSTSSTSAARSSRPVPPERRWPSARPRAGLQRSPSRSGSRRPRALGDPLARDN